MKFQKKKPHLIKDMLMNLNVPLEQRIQMIQQLANNDSEFAQLILGELLNDAAASNGENLYQEKTRELDETLNTLKQGPMRFGTVVSAQDGPESPMFRVKVRLEDGTTVLPVVPESGIAEELQRGDEVLLDAQATAVLTRIAQEESTGEEGHLERRIGRNRVELSVHGGTLLVVDASQSLIESLDRKEVPPGSKIR